MSLHTDLLKQTEFLAKKEPHRPLQASLRHAVSASYFALFHPLIEEGTRLVLSGRKRQSMRDCLDRAFRHAKMKTISRQFSSGGVSAKLGPGFHSKPVQSQPRSIAEIFCEL